MAKKIILSYLISLLFTFSISAQDSNLPQWELGIKGGVGISFVSPNKGDDKFKSGYNIGIAYSRTISEDLFFRTGIEYTTKGVDRKFSLNYQSEDGHTKFKSNGKNKAEYEMTYIQIPATIGWNFVKKKGFTTYLNSGLYMAYGTSISAMYNIDGQLSKANGDVATYKRIIKYKKWDDLDLHQFDLGIILGIGVKYNCVCLHLAYHYGALNLGSSRQNGSNTRMRWHNNNLSLSVGYNFLAK